MPCSGPENHELFDLLIADAEQPFSGWDFSYISKTDRIVETPLLWSYASRLLPHLRQARSLLHIGTGGGEFLTKRQLCPEYMAAAEGYLPNIPIYRFLLVVDKA